MENEHLFCIFSYRTLSKVIDFNFESATLSQLRKYKQILSSVFGLIIFQICRYAHTERS